MTRFHTSGNAKHWATPAYKRTSSLGGQWEQRQEPINWAVWIAIGLAFAVGVFAMNGDVFL